MDAAIVQSLQAHIIELSAQLQQKTATSPITWKDVVKLLAITVYPGCLFCTFISSIRQHTSSCRWRMFADLQESIGSHSGSMTTLTLTVVAWVFSRCSSFLPRYQFGQSIQRIVFLMSEELTLELQVRQ